MNKIENQLIYLYHFSESYPFKSFLISIAVVHNFIDILCIYYLTWESKLFVLMVAICAIDTSSHFVHFFKIIFFLYRNFKFLCIKIYQTLKITCGFVFLGKATTYSRIILIQQIILLAFYVSLVTFNFLKCIVNILI